jgi:hypothetical protein
MRDRSKSYRDQEHIQKTVEVPLLLKQQVKILYRLTGRQLLILTCGLAIGFSLWESLPILQKSVVAASIVGSVCALLSGILAFMNLDARPLEEWFVIILLWLLTPEQVSLKQLLRLFMKIKDIREDIVMIEPGGYQAVLVIEGKQFDLLSGSEQSMLIESFAHFLNGLSYGITINVRSFPYVPAVCATTIIPTKVPKTLRRWYAHYISFLSELITQKRPIRVTYYLALTLPEEDVSEHDEQSRLEQAKIQLAQRIHEVQRQLERGGLTLRRLQYHELFMFYYQSFTPQEVPQNRLSLDNLAPSAITIAGSWLKIERKHGHYLACLAISQLPRRLSPGWLHQVIETNDAASDFCLYIEPCTGETMTNYLRRKAALMKGVLQAAHKSGEGGNTMTRHALGDIERVRDRLMRKDVHLYTLSLLLIVRGTSPSEIETRVKHVQLMLQSLDFQVVLLRFQQHLGFFSTLGYGQNLIQRHTHLVTTEVAAAFLPFSNVPVMEKNILLGATANGGLVSLDIWEGFNANLAVLGIPGSGKSFFLKTISSRLASCEEQLCISILDIEGEYTGFPHHLAAAQVTLSANNLQLNPFDLRRRAVQQKSDFQEKITTLVGFLALLFGGDLTQQERALLYVALIETYKQVGITDDPETHNRPVPSMNNFAEILRRNTQTKDFAYRLTPYMHLFPDQTRVTSHKITIYNLRTLPEALLPAATYLVTERLWNTLQEARSDNEEITERHLAIIDEAWFLLKSPYGGMLLNDFARRMRKYGAGLWVGTQQIGDMLSSEQGKDLLALCNRKVLFRQDASILDVIQNTLRLSASQVKHLQTAKRGEALYISSEEAHIVEIIASEQEIALARTAKQAKGGLYGTR